MNEFGQITPGNTQKWVYTEPTEGAVIYHPESSPRQPAYNAKAPSLTRREMSSRTLPRQTAKFFDATISSGIINFHHGVSLPTLKLQSVPGAGFHHTDW